MHKITYILPNNDFFNKLESGQVSHALGCIEGYLANNINSISVYGCDVLKLKSRVDLKCNLFEIENTNLFKKIIYIKNIFDNAEKSEIIHVRAGSFFYLFLFISKLFFSKIMFNKNIVLEINGLGVKGEGSIFKLLSFIKDKLISLIIPNKCIIYVVNDNLKKRLLSFKIPDEKIITIENGCPNLSYKRELIKINDINEVLFIGVLQTYNDFDYLLSNDSNINYSIYGYGIQQPLIEKLSNKFDNINYCGVYSIDSIVKKHNLNKKVFGIVPINAQSNSHYLSPIKLYTYASMGLPVLISKDSIGRNFDLKDFNFVITYDGGESIKKIVQNISLEKYTRLVENAYLFSIKNSWKKRMELILSDI